MPKQNRSIREKTLNYAAGQTVQEEMTRGGLVLGYMCRLTGQLTCTAANNTNAKLFAGDALAVMRKLRVRINSTEHAVEYDPRSIIVDNWFTLGRFPRDFIGQLADAGASAGTLNPAFDISFVIPFEMPRRKVQLPLETALDARADRMSKLEIEVEWGSHLDVNASATGFTVAPQLQITSISSYNVDPAVSVGFLRRYLIEQTLSATNPREQIRLPTSQAYFGMVLNATVLDATNGPHDSNAVFNRIKLISNSTVFEDWEPRVLSDGYGRIWHGREGRQDAFFTSTGYLPSAYFPIEIPYDGNQREILVAAGLAELNLECDCTVGAAATKLRTFNYQYIPPLQRG
jgi:hypothetical protein